MRAPEQPQMEVNIAIPPRRTSRRINLINLDAPAATRNLAVFAAHVATSLPLLAAFATHNAKRQVARNGKPA